jgi:protocatechuate 3,4-dioxygenase beta subunit
MRVPSQARLLAGIAIAAALSGAAATAHGASPTATCKPTPSDSAGPFAGTGAAIRERSRIGTGHVLLGRVLRAPDCKPLKGATVVFWQAGPHGYTAAGRGSAVTDRFGRFRFEGPVPASDDGFPPHIHILVQLDGYQDLVTRYVVPAGERTGHVTLVLESLL